MKSRSHEIGCFNNRVALQFDRYLDRANAEMLVKFQSDWKSPNIAASRLNEMLRQDVVPLSGVQDVLGDPMPLSMKISLWLSDRSEIFTGVSTAVLRYDHSDTQSLGLVRPYDKTSY